MWNVEEILKPLEGDSRFRFVNNMIHDCLDYFRAASFFAALDAHPSPPTLMRARMVPGPASAGPYSDLRSLLLRELGVNRVDESRNRSARGRWSRRGRRGRRCRA